MVCKHTVFLAALPEGRKRVGAKICGVWAIHDTEHRISHAPTGMCVASGHPADIKRRWALLCAEIPWWGAYYRRANTITAKDWAVAAAVVNAVIPPKVELEMPQLLVPTWEDEHK